jgi:hypothetical protein
MVHHPSFFIVYIYVTVLFSNGYSQQAVMSSWCVDDPSFGPAWWTKQDLDFKANFLMQDNPHLNNWEIPT